MQRWQEKRYLLIDPTDISMTVQKKILFFKTAVSRTFVRSRIVRKVSVCFVMRHLSFILFVQK